MIWTTAGLSNKVFVNESIFQSTPIEAKRVIQIGWKPVADTRDYKVLLLDLKLERFAWHLFFILGWDCDIVDGGRLLVLDRGVGLGASSWVGPVGIFEVFDGIGTSLLIFIEYHPGS
jgi:hypothetical protein